MPGSAGSPPGAPSTIGGLGERAILDRIRARVPPAPPWVVAGIGDDAAVIEPSRNLLDVLTTDALVEGVHFDRRLCTAHEIGYRALAVNLSDLAAMGASPRAALLSLALPPALPVTDLDDLLEGFLDIARAHRLALVGGNIARSPGPLVIDVTATGSVHRRRLLRRCGAKPGDDLFVSGSIGAAAAGLAWLQARTTDATAVPADPALERCAERYRCPEPRVRLGVLVGRNRAASACVDLSDGLADAVHQLASASGVGAAIEADQVPIAEAARRWFEACGQDPTAAALGGGDDYELLFAVPRRAIRRFQAVARLVRDLPVTRIGVVTREPAVRLNRQIGDVPIGGGYSHFSS
jgi:thiamine-monophosphate kinase